MSTVTTLAVTRLNETLPCEEISTLVYNNHIIVYLIFQTTTQLLVTEKGKQFNVK